MGQKLTLKREHDNRHDKFAIAGKTMLKGKIGLVFVGHIPRELSRYTWYAIQEGRSLKLQYPKKNLSYLRWCKVDWKFQ